MPLLGDASKLVYNGVEADAAYMGGAKVWPLITGLQPPTNFAVTTDGFLDTLTWTDSTDADVTGYEIRWSYTQLADWSQGTLNVVAPPGIQMDTVYHGYPSRYYAICTVRGMERSAWAETSIPYYWVDGPTFNALDWLRANPGHNFGWGSPYDGFSSCEWDPAGEGAIVITTSEFDVVTPLSMGIAEWPAAAEPHPDGTADRSMYPAIRAEAEFSSVPLGAHWSLGMVYSYWGGTITPDWGNWQHLFYYPRHIPNDPAIGSPGPEQWQLIAWPWVGMHVEAQVLRITGLKNTWLMEP